MAKEQQAFTTADLGVGCVVIAGLKLSKAQFAALEALAEQVGAELGDLAEVLTAAKAAGIVK